jgi:ATP-dependent DNA helicase DinG
VWSHLELIKESLDEVLPLSRRTRELAEALSFWVETGNRSYVYWTERRGRGCYLQATPIDVSSILSTRLFDSVSTVILTSATLAVAGTFQYVERRLGLRNARSLIVPGHFDYANQTLLYVPQHLPTRASLPSRDGCRRDRGDPLAQPRPAFVLFTSYQQMQPCTTAWRRGSSTHSAAAHRPALGLVGPVPLDAESVLFATSSFWQGWTFQASS